MKTRIRTIAAAAMAAAIFIVTGCSSEGGGSSQTPSFADRVINDLVETACAVADIEPTDSGFALRASDSDETLFNKEDIRIYDMLLHHDFVYAAVNEGVICYNTIDGKASLIPAASPVIALADLGDKILAGGDNLYTIEDGLISGEDYCLNLAGTITALYHDFPQLYIGTTEGFYSMDINGIRHLAGNIHVSALAFDGLGIWVGTAGDGLYRWNGDSFRKRYLKRDSTLFDNVTALDFKHNHLYLGTDKGFFVYDGGSWTPFGLTDGLPSETITAIDAFDWVVRVGTARGPVTFFDNTFKPMSKLEGMVITRFIKDEDKLLAATSNAGLVMKSGGLVTTLFDRNSQSTQIAVEEKW